MKASHAKLLTQSSSLLLVLALVVYGVGVYLLYSGPCEPIGPNIAVLAVVLAFVAVVLLSTRAFAIRSALSVLALVAALVLVAVMYLAIGVMALPGCSGV
jgi:hypothetical protein